MPVLITDAGFGKTAPAAFTPLDEATDNTREVALANDANAEAVLSRLPALTAISIEFPGFTDGRGFTLARSLRLLGFAGRLRASGHILPDQYAMARRSGFDEVVISDDLAQRAPESDWLFRADWRAHDYQSRLRQCA